jgi:hypothetical protein
MTTINFCGDSFCANIDNKSWTYLVAQKLKATIIGRGEAGAAYEHAIKTFDPKADYTIFCWTHANRIYVKGKSFTPNIAINLKKASVIHGAAYIYFKYLHDEKLSKERQMHELYWFDHEVLSTYKGKCLHFRCFPGTTDYQFKHGTNYGIDLMNLYQNGQGTSFPNHFTPADNEKFGQLVLTLLHDK